VTGLCTLATTRWSWNTWINNSKLYIHV